VSARLWVTGLGLVTPLGAGVEATWAGLVRGDRGLRTIGLFDASGQRARVAGEVDVLALPAPASVAERHGKTWGGLLGAGSRTSTMAAAAAAEAMHAAAVDVHARRVGLVVGGTTSGMFENERLLARLHAEPEYREMLATMRLHPLTATGDCLDECLGPFARVRTLASACSSGANAIVVAASWLLAGEVDVVVAGGGDGLCRLTLSGFNALGALDPEPCRPFNRRRRGTNLGEGAAFLVLERAEGVRARPGGRPPIAELAGWALGAEAHHITNPAPDGALVASLIERAIARAKLGPRDIDYVNAHGTGTPLNDAMEAAALALALGGEIERVAVSSSKGQIGHTLGGAGAIQAAITALVVARRTLVPTAGLDEPDPALALVHVPHVGRTVPRVRAALSNSFGFGGMDTVLVFTEPDGGSREGKKKGTDSAQNFSTSPGVDHATAEPGTCGSMNPPVITGAAVFGPWGLLGAEQCANLPERRFSLDTPVDPDAHLDVARARRLDRAARLAVVAAQHALADAHGSSQGTGIVLGSAYGNVDDSAAFMHRVFEKGARAASPAEFPNLVPSSPVGHVSIYLGLRGPTFTTADLSASGESALVQASQLVAAGEAACLIAASVEPKSHIVQRVLSPLFARTSSHAQAGRTDVAAAVVVESEPRARAESGRVVARIRQLLEWRSSPSVAIASLQAPRGGRAEVVLPRADDGAEEFLGQTAWRSCPRVTCAPALGESDGLGAVAVAVAVGRILTERVGEALVLGVASGRGYAILLSR
jgi:3-oxoacyl-[acyl-carrier-protein] synthase II